MFIYSKENPLYRITTLSLALGGLGLALPLASANAALIYSFDSDVKTPTTDTEAEFNGGAVTAVGFTITDSNVGNPAPSIGTALNQVSNNTSLDDYYTFTITNDGGPTYSLSEISFDYQVNHSNVVHTTTFSLFSEIDSFASPIAEFTYDGSASSAFLNTGAIALGTAFQGLTADTAFRIGVDDNGSNSGVTYARIDNVSLVGGTNVIPEPASLALLGLGGLCLLSRRTRSS